jgi:hypothetical protein
VNEVVGIGFQLILSDVESANLDICLVEILKEPRVDIRSDDRTVREGPSDFSGVGRRSGAWPAARQIGRGSQVDGWRSSKPCVPARTSTTRRRAPPGRFATRRSEAVASDG